MFCFGTPNTVKSATHYPTTLPWMNTQVRGGGALAAGSAAIHLSPFPHQQRQRRRQRHARGGGGVGLRCGGGGRARGVYAPAAQEGKWGWAWAFGLVSGRVADVDALCLIMHTHVYHKMTAHRRRGAALPAGVHPRQHGHDLHPGTRAWTCI